jgi:hypothetical protein
MLLFIISGLPDGFTLQVPDIEKRPLIFLRGLLIED